MIFADKVIRMRKKNGWSQEELADRLGVSRQAVSKWESAQSVPDLQKLMQLSQLFGVTTDYLLKDELENEEFTGDGEAASVRRITLAEAGEHLEDRKHAAKRIAAAVFLCVLAPIPLIILGAASECGLSEKLATVIGMAALFLIAMPAVAIFIMSGFKNSRWEFLDKEAFETEYGVRGMVKERQDAFAPTYARLNVIAVSLCVLSPLPIFLSMFSEAAILGAAAICATMLVAGVGAVLFIVAGVNRSATQRLLREGEFSEAEKEKSKVTGAVSTVYWLAVTAAYLGLSFGTSISWDKSWIIWPVAGVCYAALAALMGLIQKKKH